MYLAHRIIWALIHGVDPGDALIDHRDGDGTNNRESNLREATHSQNHMNRRVTVGGHLKGTTFSKKDRKWQAKIQINKKQTHLGHFDTQEEAHAAYCRAAVELHGAFARFG